jgi:hypothetical protein
MLSTVNDRLLLKFAVSEGKSQRHVKNVVMPWLDFRERAKISDADPLTLAEFTSKSKDWQALRKNNGYFVGAQFKGGIRHKINARPRQLLTYDIDQGNNALIDDLRNGTSGVGPIEYLAYSTRTHGNGAIKLRLVIPLPKLLPEERFNPLSRILAEAIDPDMRMVDPVSFKPSQYMYWPSHCADVTPVFIHHEGALLDADRVLANWASAWGDWSDFRNLPRSEREQERLRADVARSADPTTKRGPVGVFCNLWNIHKAVDEFDVPYVPGEMGPNGIPARYTYIHGTSSNGVVVYDDGNKAHSHHSSDPLSDQNFNSFDMVRVHLFGNLDGAREPGDDPRKMPSYKAMLEMLQDNVEFTSALRDSYYGISPEDADDIFDAEYDAPAAEVTSKIVDDDDWGNRLDTNEKGTIKSTLYNIILILRHSAMFEGRFGYNEFAYQDCLLKPMRVPSLRINHRIKPGKTFMPLEDIHFHTVRQVLEAPRGSDKTGWGLRVSDRDLKAALSVVCDQNTFNPPRDYLEGLVWDGESRLDKLWVNLCHVPDTPYYRAAARNFLTGAVARICSPGTKFDFVVVLIGKTGIRKSTAVRVLGSPAWTTSSPGNYDNKQKFVEASLGFWFIEHGEMQHFRRAGDDEGIKAALSEPNDNIRLAYRLNAKVYERQFVIVGTTEDTQFLRAYHRRIWPIQCGDRTLDIEWLRANRDQLFAEAVVSYRKLVERNDPLELPLDLRGEADAEHRRTQTANLLPDDIAAKAGIVREYLEEEVPLVQSRPGWDTTDAAFSDHETIMVKRTVTCAIEIFARALGNDPVKYDRRAAQIIGDIMKMLEPEWKSGQHGRCGRWGIQRTYRKAGSL